MEKKFKWTHDTKIGFDEIDSQHRLLFAIANELCEIKNTPDNAYQYKYLFSHLGKYVKEHFVAEEKLMNALGYPDLSEHKKKHEKIIEEMNNCLKTSKSLENLKNNLENLLGRWIKEHIRNEDKKLQTWYKDQVK